MLNTITIAALTRKHVARYEGMKAQAAVGDGTINAEECDHYLRIWRGIEEHRYEWQRLAPFQRAELLEALEDE